MLNTLSRRAGLAAIAAMLSFAPVQVVSAQDEPTQDEPAAERSFVFSQDEDMFIVGTAIDIMFHEAGHMVIDVFDIPILGQEEDAADNFATLALLSMEDEYASAALMQGIGGGYLMGANVELGNSAYFGAHDLSVQRASRKVCHLISAEPDTYGELATALELDQDTIELCTFQFGRTLDNWVKTLEQKDAFGESDNLISVTYHEAEEGFEPYRQILMENGVLEYVAQYLGSELKLPREVKLSMQHCGTANAFYISSESEMTFCYEFASLLHYFFVTTNAEDEAEAAVTEEPAIEGGAVKP